MKKTITVFLICISQTLIAQTYDEDVVMKACDCIHHAESNSIDSIANACLTKAQNSLAEEGISNPANASVSNRTILANYLNTLYRNCSAIKNLIEKKQSRYYKMSGSTEANHYYLEGIEYEKQSKADSAIISYNKALTYDSRFVNALDKAGALYRQMDEIDNAILYSEKSLQIFPEGYNALLNLSIASQTANDFRKAISNYAKLIWYYPEDPEGYFGLGVINFSDRDYLSTARLMKRAYMLYAAQGSDRTLNCREYLRASYYYLKKEGKEILFTSVAKEFVPPVYQAENFDQLKNIELNSKIDCRLMESQVLICSNYIFSTPANDKNLNRQYATEAIIRWMGSTPDYIFHIDRNISKILDEKGDILAVFIAAMTKFSIENPEWENNQITQFALNATLSYAANKANNIQLTSELKKIIKSKKSTLSIQ